jgi:hypothetical protein
MNKKVPSRILASVIAFLFLGLSLMDLPERGASARQQDKPVSVSPLQDTRLDAAGAAEQEAALPPRVGLPSQRRGIAIESLDVSLRLPAFDRTNHRKSRANEIGVVRAVQLTSAAKSSHVIENADGSRVRVVKIQSPGALEMRVYLADFDLPEGDEVYLYGQADRARTFGPYRRQGTPERNKGARRGDERGFWSNTVSGDTIVVEHYIHNVERPFNIAKVAHLYKAAITNPTQSILECEVDAKCVNDSTNNAVARLSFIDGDSARTCSGTILNNQTGDMAPFLLTARHCVRDATVADTVEARWLYQSTSCNSGTAAPGKVSPVGATLLNTDADSDQTLLRIFYGVPTGVTYAGFSSNSQDDGTSVYGLHHPFGSFLRRSEGSIGFTSLRCDAIGGSIAYGTIWHNGVTEFGSDGSGLFLSGLPGFLIGVNSCVPFECGTETVYSKFSDFYPDVSDYLTYGERGKNPVALTIGNTYNGSLSFSSSVDRIFGVDYFWQGFYFSGQAGQRVQITMTSPNFNTYLLLVGPNHVLEAADDDSGGGTNARITATLLKTGTYIIGATSFDVHETGTFQLSTQLVTRFDDVPSSSVFYRYANLLAEYGITVGCNPPANNLYCPSQAVTREQMAAFVMRSLGEFDPPAPPSQRFADVIPANVFYRFIDRLAVLGITVGCNPPTNNLYCPSSAVTREQMSAFLMRALGEPNPPTPPFQRFGDVFPSNVFYRFIDRLAERHITVGCNPAGTLYCPSDAVTREQMAAFIVRAFQLE